MAALRFFTVYGPRQRPDLAIHKFTRMIHRGEPLVLYGDGTTSRDYTFVSDIVQGILSALKWTRSSARPGEMEIFNLGGSRTTSLIDLVRMIEKELGKKAEIRWEARQPGDVERRRSRMSRRLSASGVFSGFSDSDGDRQVCRMVQERELERLSDRDRRSRSRSPNRASDLDLDLDLKSDLLRAGGTSGNLLFRGGPEGVKRFPEAMTSLRALEPDAVSLILASKVFLSIRAIRQVGRSASQRFSKVP